TVSDNSGFRVMGGGVYNAGAATLTNCTVSDNSGFSATGGGVYNAGAATLTNCTLSGNSGGTGGGVWNSSTVTMGNTIVAGNTASTGPDVLGGVNSQGDNLIGETDGSSGWVATDLTGTSALPLDPLLAPLGNYGGPTQTMALLPGSPAIDAGTGTGAP